MIKTTTIRLCRDETCPACRWPETYAEVDDTSDEPSAHAIGCSKCGWRVEAGGLPVDAVVTVVKHLLVGSVPEVDLWVHRDGNPEIVAQITPDQAAVLRAAGWSDEWPEVDSDA